MKPEPIRKKVQSDKLMYDFGNTANDYCNRHHISSGAKFTANRTYAVKKTPLCLIQSRGRVLRALRKRERWYFI